ncbi:arabinogalactan endo-beta-1,4-galactanase [Bacillus sp. PS06]|uniref:glycoside hydrolase family 53 protein n=1 Tax=Bacillus sp. PS06 TaxID=2764176 RepID=UPI00178639CD|nr:arabinogalactan endo-1,4-beta-galactosidase [Bacillus sp. PS06]MBD8070744.1 glycosyl hydrolase 53 family protein [Bacillus sp. PS06]
MSRRFLNGVDISFVDEIETEGGKFYDNNKEVDVIALLKLSGVNSIRLRLWNEPTGGYCNLERTIQVAKRIKENGLHFLLDFHYSDYWADPGKQTKPKDWANLSFTELTEAVHTFTKDTIQTLKSEAVLPDMVQIGNEIINGMLWDEGRVMEDGFDNDKQWENLARLIKAGLSGLHDALTSEDHVETMIHIDRGGDNKNSRKFFDKIHQLDVTYDVIGLSFYPWWHGTMSDLEENLNDLATRYEKDIVVVEVAYPWTLASADPSVENIFNSEEQLIDGYPATVEGQSAYLKDLIKIIKNTPNQHGVGVYYWEPCWIPSKKEWSVGHDNGWANLTLFDFDGNKLDSLDVFKEDK